MEKEKRERRVRKFRRMERRTSRRARLPRNRGAFYIPRGDGKAGCSATRRGAAQRAFIIASQQRLSRYSPATHTLLFDTLLRFSPSRRPAGFRSSAGKHTRLVISNSAGTLIRLSIRASPMQLVSILRSYANDARNATPPRAPSDHSRRAYDSTRRRVIACQ